jgi:branched-chain amino acid transport system substrate-binding protein
MKTQTSCSYNQKASNRTSRRAFAPGLLSLFAPALLAKSNNPDVTITAGGLFSLTGNSSDLGTQSKLMMTIASKDVDPLFTDFNMNPPSKNVGVDFHLLFEDTQLDPQKAAAAASRLIQQGAQFLIGPQTSAEVARVKPITDAAGVVLVSPGSTASSLSIPNDTVFRFVPDDKLESKAVAHVAVQAGIKAICPVWRGDDGNRGLANSLKQFGPGLGLAVAAGIEYPASGANFASVAGSLAAIVAQLKLTYSLNQIAIFLGAFDEGADLLTASSGFSDLAAIRWFAGDGVTLSNVFLSPAVAQFALATQFLAPSLGLPPEADPVIAPILTETAAAGVPSPTAFSFAAYDGFVCATLALLLAGGDKTKVSAILPQVAKRYFGPTGWTLLNAAGDREIGNFEFFGIVNQQGGYSWKGVLVEQVTG